MIERVIYHMVQLKGYLILSLVVGVVLSTATVLLLRKFNFQSRRLGLYGFFYAMSGKQTLRLILELNRLLYIVYLLLSGKELMRVHVLVLAGYVVLQLLTASGLSDLFVTGVNGLILTGGVYICSVFRGYMLQLHKSSIYVPVYVLLILFLILYTLVLFALNIRRMTDPAELDKNRERRKNAGR